MRNLARNPDGLPDSQPEARFYLETRAFQERARLGRGRGAEHSTRAVARAGSRTRPVALFLFRHAPRRRSPWSGARLRNLSPPVPLSSRKSFFNADPRRERECLGVDRVARRVVRGSTPATAPRARSRSQTPEADIPTPASPSSEPQRRHGRRPRAPLQAETTPQHDRSLARAHARGQPRQAERRRRGTEGEVARAVARARREGFRALGEELDPRVRVRLPDAPPGRALSPTPRRCRVVRLGKRQRRSLWTEICPPGDLRGRRRDGFAARIALER